MMIIGSRWADSRHTVERGQKSLHDLIKILTIQLLRYIQPTRNDLSGMRRSLFTIGV